MTEIAPYRTQTRLSDERKQTFLRVLSETGVLIAAARAASPYATTGALQSFIDEARRDHRFATAMEESKQTYAATILEALNDRLLNGVSEPVFQRGKRAVDHDGSPASVRRHDVRYFELALRNRLVFKDQFAQTSKVNQTITNNANPNQITLTPAEIFALPPHQKAALADALRTIATMRKTPLEEVEQQEQLLLEHAAEEGEFTEIAERLQSPSPRETWEDL